MTTLDPDMGAAVHRAMERIGIDVHTETTVIGFETGSDGRIRSVLTAHDSIPADVVILGLGVRPNTALAQKAGLPLGDHGGLRTNVQMQVLGHDRQDDRRTLHRPSAGSADRRRRGIGQADRHGCDGAMEPHDGRRGDGPGPRVRSAVLAGVGSDSRGGAAGRRGSAPDMSPPTAEVAREQRSARLVCYAQVFVSGEQNVTSG
jgi:hypothetical protein